MYDDLLWAVLKAIPQVVLANWPLFAVIGVILLVTWALELARRRRLARSGITEIDQMDGKTFEQRLAILFHKLGYRVEQTRYRGDYGADLVISKDGVKRSSKRNGMQRMWGSQRCSRWSQRKRNMAVLGRWLSRIAPIPSQRGRWPKRIRLSCGIEIVSGRPYFPCSSNAVTE